MEPLRSTKTQKVQAGEIAVGIHSANLLLQAKRARPAIVVPVWRVVCSTLLTQALLVTLGTELWLFGRIG